MTPSKKSVRTRSRVEKTRISPNKFEQFVNSHDIKSNCPFFGVYYLRNSDKEVYTNITEGEKEITGRSFISDYEARLSPYAARESLSRGREKPQEASPLRGEYQRDRDRIIHSKSFRRLMHKTQVFIAPEGEHYRTRLTHTLEVTGIARTIARSLGLNEDLAEASALGHDLGHTPFGHIGESALRECYSKDFSHYAQSLRVVDRLERDGAGLNLMWEVRDAIYNHQGENQAATLEGRILKFADRIAYVNHDIDDAVRAGILKESDLPAEFNEILGTNHSERINTMVESVLSATSRLLGDGTLAVAMEDEVGKAADSLRSFLFERVYYSREVLAEEKRAKELIFRLFEHYCHNPGAMPDFYNSYDDPVERRVCDFISGMTDRLAISVYSELTIPRGWNG